MVLADSARAALAARIAAGNKTAKLRDNSQMQPAATECSFDLDPDIIFSL
jgi:hypothetical protein